MTRSETGFYKSVIDNLSALRAFVTVVESGSFSEAGYRLNVVPSTISKHVSSLEERIGGQLLLRSTKQFSVTELGRRFYERCLSILHEVEVAEVELGEYKLEPQGRLRVTAPTVFAAKHLAALIPGFLKRYPKISVELKLTANVIDLIGDAIDVAIRVSSNLDPSLIAVKIAPNIRSVCVAPSYIEQYGRPLEPRELAEHNCIVASESPGAAKWPFSGGPEEQVAVKGNLIVNNGDVYRAALIDGVGIGYVARYLVYEDIKSGALIELFSDRRVTESFIYAVYPERRNLPLKTRVFIDYIREAFRVAPEWAV